MRNSQVSDRSVRATGLFLGIVFLLGGLYDTIFVLFFKKAVTSIGVLYAAICFAMAVLLYLSTRTRKLVWVQPIVLLAATALAVLQDYKSFFGMSFFFMAFILLYRLGFFLSRKLVKLVGVFLIFFGAELAGAFAAHKSPLHALGILFFIAAFLLFLYLSYEEKLMVYLKEPKPQISLAERGFTPLESAYVFAIIEGKSAKEIAFDMKVTESTARNNISRAFHKLGLTDRHEFTILSLKNEIVA